MSNWTLLFEPGADQLAYSNAGFGLLGRLLQRHHKETWEQLFSTLASILGMHSTSATVPQDIEAKQRIAYGYQGGEPIPLQELGFSNPAGGVHIDPHFTLHLH
jgi:CubicO group peptidase (beta-lactamase class C family)